eukprot:g47625.t1
MEFNLDECEVFYFDKTNQGRNYTVNDRALGAVVEQRDVGLQVHGSLEVVSQIDRVVMMAFGTLVFIGQNVQKRTWDGNLQLYLTFKIGMRPAATEILTVLVFHFCWRCCSDLHPRENVLICIDKRKQHNIDSSVIYGCLAMDYYPGVASVTWKKRGQSITAGFKTYPSVRNKQGTYTLSSQLAINESGAECGHISCEVRQSGSDKSTGMP